MPSGDELFARLVLGALASFERIAKLDEIAQKVLITRKWVIDLHYFQRDVFFALKDLERDGKVSTIDSEVWEIEPLTRLALEG